MSAARRRRLRRTVIVAAGLLTTTVLVLATFLGRADPAFEAASGFGPESFVAPGSPVAPSGQVLPVADGGSPVPDMGSARPLPRGNGEFTVQNVPGTDSPASGRTVRYTVEVEGGLEAEAAAFAAKVAQTLRDPRGWEGSSDNVHFEAVSASRAERSARGTTIHTRVMLASPDTVDKLCYPLRTNGEVSCYARGRVVLNYRRWMLGASSYGDDVRRYRTYLINHEVGHALGHGHTICPALDAKAPVMLQQTLGLHGCRSWPYPVMAD